MLVGKYGRNTLDFNTILNRLQRQIEYYQYKYNAREEQLRILIHTRDVEVLKAQMKWVGVVSVDHATLRPRILGVLAYELNDVDTTVVLCDV